jgi:phosphoglycerate dehydrogenase-like enzyme
VTPVLISWLDPQPESEVAFAQDLLPDGFVIAASSDGGSAERERLLADADAIVTRHVAVGAEVLSAAPRARFVQKYGGREDGLDLDAAERAGVAVAVMPLRGCVAVAELAMTLVLALSKELVAGHAATVSGAYRDLGVEPVRTSERVIAFQWMKLTELFEVYGKTLGIVGYGEIGTEVSKRARAFGMNVLYTKRTRLPGALEDRLGVTWRDLDDLLAESDVVLLTLPHTPESERLIGARELELMRSDAYLVNTARGGLVNEDALVDALRERRIAGAALDVFVDEPVPYDHPLLALDNVILTPHIGGGTGGARVKQMSDVLDNIVRFFRDGKASHVVRGRAEGGDRS